MNNQDTIKNILIVIGVLIVIFLAYKFLVPAKEDAGSGLSDSKKEVVAGSGSVDVADVKLLQKKLDGVKVDTEIFKEEDFNSLEDFRTVISPQPVGRDNPFSGI